MIVLILHDDTMSTKYYVWHLHIYVSYFLDHFRHNYSVHLLYTQYTYIPAPSKNVGVNPKVKPSKKTRWIWHLVTEPCKAPKVQVTLLQPGFRSSNPLLASIWRQDDRVSYGTSRGLWRRFFFGKTGTWDTFFFEIDGWICFQLEKIYESPRSERELNWKFMRCLTCVMEALKIYRIRVNILAIAGTLSIVESQKLIVFKGLFAVPKKTWVKKTWILWFSLVMPYCSMAVIEHHSRPWLVEIHQSEMKWESHVFAQPGFHGLWDEVHVLVSHWNHRNDSRGNFRSPLRT